MVTRVCCFSKHLLKSSVTCVQSIRSLSSSECLQELDCYEVIVVGGGHAGCEAATAAARVGARTLLLTHKISTIGEMSCNPSFGGIGKGHLIKEIDALDGICGKVCDISGIQYRMLNRKKGPAVWGPRAQIDRDLYRNNMQNEIFNTPNLSVLEASVEDLLTTSIDFSSDVTATPDAKCRCVGVVLADGTKISTSSVVLTAGTFLRGRINIGMNVREAGRLGDAPAVGLAKTIEDLGFTMGRLKTGTPPRIDRQSVDFSNMEPYYADDPSIPFSFENKEVWIKPQDQKICHTTWTKPELKNIVLDTMDQNLHVIEEVNGPRYCPSIESKILKFQDQNYMCWLEPEGLESDVLYLQGFSCTMPEEHQRTAVRLVNGLERAEITRFGYGVEYDFMDPRQVAPTLQTYRVPGLFFAGQINGTTGYEEAAAQGLIAGVNAARSVKGLPDFTVSRGEGYIGVLIDDLTTLGTNEPYRMFTSRSEFRMSLRPDNADERLTSRGYHDAGCVSLERQRNTEERLKALHAAVDDLKSIKLSLQKWRTKLGLSASQGQSHKSGLEILGDCSELGCSTDPIMTLTPNTEAIRDDRWLFERLKAEALYCNVIRRQQKDIDALKRDEHLLIPNAIDYSKVPLKLEIREKLAKARPLNMAAATRIQGMTPAALLQLLVFVKKANFESNHAITSF